MFRFPPLTPFTKKLIIVLLATFVTSVVLEAFGILPIVRLLALGSNLGVQTTWQIFTYVFVSPPSGGGVMWFFIGLVFLWLMMAPFETRFGPRAALQLSIVSVLAAAIPFVLVALVGLPGIMIGIAPLFLGIIGAMYASVPKDAQMSFFGVLPMKPIVLVLVFVGLSVLSNLAERNFAAIFGDLGAMAGGIAFVRWWLLRPLRPRRRPPPRNGGRRKRPRKFEVIDGGGKNDPPRYLN